MSQFVMRHLTGVLTGLALVVGALLVSNLFLAARLAAVVDRADDQEAQLARIEVGTGLFASQVTELQGNLALLAPRVRERLVDAVAGLDAFRTSTIAFTVPINEEIPIDTEVVLDRTLNVPIQTSVPIDETIDTTIVVQGPFGSEIPIDVTVPVQLDLPVDVEVPISVNEVIPISTRVPVRLTLPVDVAVQGTELETLVTALRQGLAAFAELMAGYG